MRNIPPASLAALQQASGIEPVLIVKVSWAGGQQTAYCDRKFESEGLVGKLIEISGIEDVVDINAGSSSVSLSVVLDDSDGALKGIFDNNDIHGTYVQVLQWFTAVPITDAFVIYEGVLSSPISWSEGARTLKFDVITLLEDKEVGYSIEEGSYDYIPTNLVGVSWPIVVGTVVRHKPVALNDTPSITFATGFAVVNADAWDQEDQNLRDAITKAIANAKKEHQAGVHDALIAAQFKGGVFFEDNPETADQYDSSASQHYAQADQYSNEFYKLTDELNANNELRGQQEAYHWANMGRIPVNVSHIYMGPDVPARVIYGQVNNFLISGVLYSDNTFQIISLAEKPNLNENVGTTDYTFSGNVVNSSGTGNGVVAEYKRDPEKGQKFQWIDGGATLSITNFPREYILGIGNLQVINVWGSTKNGSAIVPPSYYRLEYGSLGVLPYTRLIFDTPLQYLPGDWQGDNIEVDVTSLSLGKNIIDVMAWVIANFTKFAIDATSFSSVRSRVDGMPANFVLDKRINAVEFLKDVAFQARCAIWLNDGKFFVRFLPDDLSPVDTITDSDVEVNSLELTTTDTEKLVTKFVATWKETNNQSTPNKIILRYNIEKYGTKEETYDFWIYNQYDFVAKAAEFWLIRKSNAWKRIKCKLFLNKLRLESFDPVTFNFTEGIVASAPVIGIIEKATYNPDDNTISMEAWLPVRLGEMTPYTFAYPGTVTNVFPEISDPHIQTGNPFQDDAKTVIAKNRFSPRQAITFSHAQGASYTHGTGLPGNQDPAGNHVITVLATNSVNQARPLSKAGNNQKRVEVRDPPLTDLTPAMPATFPGKIQSKVDDSTYLCEVYFKGLANKATADVKVKIFFSVKDEDLIKGYPITVVRNIYEKLVNNVLVKVPELWAQPPLWVPNESENPA